MSEQNGKPSRKPADRRKPGRGPSPAPMSAALPKMDDQGLKAEIAKLDEQITAARAAQGQRDGLGDLSKQLEQATAARDELQAQRNALASRRKALTDDRDAFRKLQAREADARKQRAGELTEAQRRLPYAVPANTSPAEAAALCYAKIDSELAALEAELATVRSIGEDRSITRQMDACVAKKKVVRDYETFLAASASDDAPAPAPARKLSDDERAALDAELARLRDDERTTSAALKTARADVDALHAQRKALYASHDANRGALTALLDQRREKAAALDALRTAHNARTFALRVERAEKAERDTAARAVADLRRAEARARAEEDARIAALASGAQAQRELRELDELLRILNRMASAPGKGPRVVLVHERETLALFEACGVAAPLVKGEVEAARARLRERRKEAGLLTI